MTGHRIKLKGYRVSKAGKVVKTQAHKDVSARLREKAKPKQRFKKGKRA